MIRWIRRQHKGGKAALVQVMVTDKITSFIPMVHAGRKLTSSQVYFIQILPHVHNTSSDGTPIDELNVSWLVAHGCQIVVTQIKTSQTHLLQISHTRMANHYHDIIRYKNWFGWHTCLEEDFYTINHRDSHTDVGINLINSEIKVWERGLPYGSFKHRANPTHCRGERHVTGFMH